MESHPKLQNPENIITLVQHEHPLQLVDLQPCYPDYVEYSDDEEEDKVIKWDFNNPCDECGKDINVYHRYYYKCTDLCDYVLHKLCAKAPPTMLVVKSHHPTHKLTLSQLDNNHRYCYACQTDILDEMYYDCSICPLISDCSIHVKCATIGREKHVIYHPSHPHPLCTLISQTILCNCDACGKIHEGIFYHCTTCSDYTIHTDCAFLPRKLQIHHTHPLTISYSSHYMDQSLKVVGGFRCMICRAPFFLNYLWIYKCDGCRYFVHVDCATSRYKFFLSAGLGKTIKNFKDDDHPNLVNLPFPDQTHSILQHWFSKESGSTTFETSERSLNHISHHHVLRLIGTQSNDSKGATSSSVSSVSCHDPMKMIELLCNGCVRPIMDVPFYKCSSEDKCCDFVLHEWCTRLPAELPNYPGHPEHSLIFLPKVMKDRFGIFYCQRCNLECNGFAYGCTECKYYIDVNCGFIPNEVTHEAHPNHILSRCERPSSMMKCVAEGKDYGSFIGFSCLSCDFYLHADCALFLPGIINHKLDKHPMKLTYGPVENHKSEYFCEVCEEELNPNFWFYHCHACLYSLHTRCAPVILNFEAAHKGYGRSLYTYLNIKFGGIYNIKDHEHSVSLAHSADGKCTICKCNLRHAVTLKCLNCSFTAHMYCLWFSKRSS